MRTHARALGAAVLACALALAAAAPPADAQSRSAFRICADPNYLPWSNKAQEGYENRIGALLARQLDLPVEYTWFPQRMGFIRNTLRARNDAGEYKCDVVMGLPTGYELAITTRPYYHSIYALVFVKGRGLDDVKSAADLPALPPERLSKVRFGLAERNPGTVWLAQHGLLDLITKAYASQSGDPGEHPGAPEQRDLLAGNIDATVMWGPIAGYFARENQGTTPIAVLPIASTPAARMHFGISAGVRFGQKEARDELQRLLDENKPAIDAILRDYGVPLVDARGELIAP